MSKSFRIYAKALEEYLDSNISLGRVTVTDSKANVVVKDGANNKCARVVPCYVVGFKGEVKKSAKQAANNLFVRKMEFAFENLSDLTNGSFKVTPSVDNNAARVFVTGSGVESPALRGKLSELLAKPAKLGFGS
ncbi:MAG: hypothetical protein PHW76_01875 [Alphaproteobacteria bacterium]|nr:hypothetical protein [Alphaproteobacteria bacterium]